jgi:hypothetical protein
MEDKNIRVCLKCRKYIILNETGDSKNTLERFNIEHNKHSLITTKFSEIDELECGKVTCADNDIRNKMELTKKKK